MTVCVFVYTLILCLLQSEAPTDKSLSEVDPEPIPPTAPKISLSLPPLHSPTTMSLLTDTTAQHSMHIFDHNCDICTGKAPPPTDVKPRSSVKDKKKITEAER